MTAGSWIILVALASVLASSRAQEALSPGAPQPSQDAAAIESSASKAKKAAKAKVKKKTKSYDYDKSKYKAKMQGPVSTYRFDAQAKPISSEGKKKSKKKKKPLSSEESDQVKTEASSSGSEEDASCSEGADCGATSSEAER